jgi:hypothetical protein
MPIRIDRIHASDLHELNDIYLFDIRRRDGQAKVIQRLSAFSVVAHQENYETTLDRLCDECAIELISSLDLFGLMDEVGWCVEFFAAQPNWVADSAVSNHRKLWMSNAELKDFSKHIDATGPVYKFSSEEGVRFATIVPLDRASFPTAAKLERRQRCHAILLRVQGGAPSRDAVASVFAAASSSGLAKSFSSVSWENLCAELCPRGIVVVRAAGWFDDREVSIDLFWSRDSSANHVMNSLFP